MSAPVPVRLQTSVWNPMGARRALLLHGLSADSAGWWRIASGLADDGYMVLAPDLRSHGRSPAAADHRLEAFAEDVLLLGESYDLVIGHSLGGAVAAELLARPGFSDTAVLLDPLLVLAAADRAEVRSSQRREVETLEIEEVRRANPRWSARDVELKVAAAKQVTPAVVDAVFEDNDPWDISGVSTGWTSRVHVLAGDPELGAMLAPELLERLCRSEHVTGEVIAGCGHSVHREQPERVLAAAREVRGR